MTNKAKVTLITAGLFLVMVSALIGSITGTLAWYMYYVRATASFSGTSVADAEQIQIGIRLENNQDFNVTDLSKDTADNDQTILWAKAGKGLTSNILTDYLNKAGYASRNLNPVTSAAYEDGDDIHLYKAPVAGSWFDSNAEAETDHYVRLPLTFRIINVATASDLKNKYVKNQAVYITDMTTSASVGFGDNNNITFIDNAIRVHVDDKKSQGNKFIIKPSAKDDEENDMVNDTLVNKEMNVGGVLKLAKGNDYYDQDRVDANTYREHIYGFTEAGCAALYNNGTVDTVTYTDEQAALNEIDNINGSKYFGTGEGQHNTMDSFVSKHGAGLCVKADTAESLAKYNNAMPKQKYYNYAQIKGDNSGATITGGKVITTTGNGSAGDYDVNDYIGECVLTIWLEGWDHSVIDEELEHVFNLGIQFEVNSTRGS